MPPGSVFVYGTLKPGERNYPLAEYLGVSAANEASLDGFVLWDLQPEGYPAMTRGEGTVRGYLLKFPDLDAALPYLDRLEGLDEQPSLYRRERVTANGPCGPTECWTYLYARETRLRQTGARAAGGTWTGHAGQEHP